MVFESEALKFYCFGTGFVEALTYSELGWFFFSLIIKIYQDLYLKIIYHQKSQAHDEL